MADKDIKHPPNNAREVPHIECAEDILHLRMQQMRILAKDWDVDLSGLHGADDMHDRLIKFWIDRRQNTKGETTESIDLATALQEHKKTRMSLYEKYKKTERLFEQFTRKLQSNLEESHHDVRINFTERKESLKSGECTIVIAGEVGAGKTSLLNLILETQIFPIDALKCTNTIVEIRYSDNKEAIFYCKPKISETGKKVRLPPKLISLKSTNDIQEFKDCVTECDQSEDNPYHRCEVFYPFKTLSKGVVIVDSPGIEGGNNVDHRLQTYLSRAFGFIYVINTNTAGGVQQSRLGHLLKTVVNESEDFSPEASLFIGNKWENIPIGDRNAVQQDIFYKMNEIYHGIRQTQIQYMSVKKALEFHLNYNQKLEEHAILMRKVGNLVPNSLRQGMLSHYSWLSTFLARSSYLLRVTSVQQEMSREELERQFAKVHKHVTDLQKSTEECIGRLRFRVEYEIKKIIKEVQNILEDKAFVGRLSNWEDKKERLKPDKRWKRIADAASVKISERIAHELDVWQKQKGTLQMLDNEIISVFRKELGLMDNQIKELEDYLANSHKKSMNQKVCVERPKTFFTLRKPKKVEKTYSTLGGAVSCMGMLNTDKKKVRNIFKKDFDEVTQAKKMFDATLLYVDTILKHKDFDGKLRKFFDRYFIDIDEAAKRIPGFLKADKQLIETLRTSIEEDDRLKQTLPGLVKESNELLGKLDIFYIYHIMNFDYDLSELDWEGKKELGRGAYATVYQSKLKKRDRAVALKVSIDEVNEFNVTEILNEDRTLRDLKHANIVRYYGASYIKTKNSLQWIMVIELCRTTLQQIYTGSERNECRIPGCLGKDHHQYADAAKYVLDHAHQICLGLDYIHERGYTHRDMKLENVLITEANIIKITDVGVTKVTKMLHQTEKGSPAYMAPEVLLSDRAQTNKTDIYSFSIMFWEMWFGRDVVDEMTLQCFGHGIHGNAIDELKYNIAKPDGWRPSLSSSKRPPDLIIDVLKRGWSFNPEMRPSAKDFGNIINHVLKGFL